MEKYYCKNCKITMEGITGDRECPECESIMFKVEPNTYKFETNNMQNRIREEWQKWAFTHKQHLGRMCDRKEIEDYWISKIDSLLKTQREELVEKLEEYKMNYNPIGDDINKGRRLACDDILYLIKNNNYGN